MTRRARPQKATGGQPRGFWLHAIGLILPLPISVLMVRSALHSDDAAAMILLALWMGAAPLLAFAAGERRQAAVALRASEERFRAAFEQAAVGMFHTDLEGHFTRVNKRFCTITGYSAGELLALSCAALTHPDDLPESAALIEQLLADETQPGVIEKRYVRKDGTVIWVHLTVSPVLGPDGAPVQIQSVVEEVTSRKLAERALRQLNMTLEQRVDERTVALSAANDRLQAEIAVRGQIEQSLRESEQQYRALLESLEQGVVVFQDERIVFCNTAMASILGHSATDLISFAPEQLWALICAEDRERLSAMFSESVSTGVIVSNEPFRFYRPNGELRWLYTASRIIVYGGRPALLGVVGDITELKRAEERLRLANLELARAARLKDEFLANVSHELRTPLNAILGRAELLAEEIHGPLTERQRRSVASIAESGRHLLELINDLLDIAKIEADKLDLQHEPVSVSDLCEASIRLVGESAIKKGLRLSSDLDPQVAVIVGDPRRLKQILVNLLANAVKFTPAGGSLGLEVRGDKAAGQVTFTIWDTGIGIAAEDLPRLFRPFEQLDSSLSRQYEGTGLGLSLVDRLARLHGGNVAVESAPGRGSRFSVTLPWRPKDG